MTAATMTTTSETLTLTQIVSRCAIDIGVSPASLFALSRHQLSTLLEEWFDRNREIAAATDAARQAIP